MNPREKGKRGERQWRDELRANGYMARRGQQFTGSPDSPDVVCDELAWIHFEVKAVERLNIEDAMEQARRDAGSKSPVVAHRRSHRRWLVTMEAEFFFELIREFQPQMHADEHRCLPQEGARSAKPCEPQMNMDEHRFGNAFGEAPNAARETRALPATRTTSNNKDGRALTSAATEREKV